MECFWLKRKALLMRKNLTRSLICVLTYREIRSISPCQHSMKFRAQIKFLKSLKINTSLKNSIVKKYMSILVYLPLPLHFIPSLFHFCIYEVPVPDTGYRNRVPQLPQLGKSCRTALPKCEYRVTRIPQYREVPQGTQWWGNNIKLIWRGSHWSHHLTLWSQLPCSPLCPPAI